MFATGNAKQNFKYLKRCRLVDDPFMILVQVSSPVLSLKFQSWNTNLMLSISRALKTLIPIPKAPKCLLQFKDPQTSNLPHRHIQFHNYVNVYMKWKKDSYVDSIDHIHKSLELKKIVALKNIIAQNPNNCIPISDVSKKGLKFDVKIKVARYLRQYPSVFQEFAGPKHNLPWFRLTQEALEIDREERRVFEECKEDIIERLVKFVSMSEEKVVPLKIVQGMLWYLGLPEDFLRSSDLKFDGRFRIVDLGDGLQGLGVEDCGNLFSVMQQNAAKKGLYGGDCSTGAIEFPLFVSKGVRLKRKIDDWLKDFQKLPYVSPYEDYSKLDPTSDVAEKRVVGFLHELLCLFVEHSAERKKLLCLKKHFGLPQKVHKAFERHPHMFYLSFRNKTCTAVLKEAYCDELAVEKHPMLTVRKRYVELMNQSPLILKIRRRRSRCLEDELDLNRVDEEEVDLEECKQ